MHVQAPIQYPAFLDQARTLVAEHRQLADEPLLFAMYYAPARDPQDVFVFEVAENFGSNSVGTDRQLFEVTYGPSPGFPLESDQRLHLVLTNPAEFEVALRERWELMEEARQAAQRGQYHVLFAAPGTRCEERLLG